MNKTKMFVPTTIKVGYQKRKDTYTKKLAYVIYYRGKKLCKEKSWESWRDKSISPEEFSNEPTEGFVLNKNVGGYSVGWGHHRSEYARVYDPRGFEFEITFDNLLFILANCGCSPGKGLEGKFVYAWDKTTLVLLPECSQEYKECLYRTTLLGQKVSVKSLVEGHTYYSAKDDDLLYLGKRQWWEVKEGVKTTHVFYSKQTNRFFDIGKPKLNVCLSDQSPANYAEIVQEYLLSANGSGAAKLEVIDKETVPIFFDLYRRYSIIQESDTSVLFISHYRTGVARDEITVSIKEDGTLGVSGRRDKLRVIEEPFIPKQLLVTLQSGAQFLFSENYHGLFKRPTPQDNEQQQQQEEAE